MKKEDKEDFSIIMSIDKIRIRIINNLKFIILHTCQYLILGSLQISKTFLITFQ